MIQDYFKLGMQNLQRRRLRSSLTIIGIIISIATIFVLISLSIGLNNAIKEQFRQLGSDKIFIMPKGQLGASGGGGAAELTTKDVEIVEKVNGVEQVVYFGVGNAKITYRDQNRYYIIIGMPIDRQSIQLTTESMNIKLDEGRFLKPGDTKKIILGYSYKYNNLYNRPVKTGERIKINDVDFEVVGILQSIGNPSDDQQVYISYDDFKEMFSSNERVDEMIIKIKPGENMQIVSDNIKRKLMNYRNVDEKTIDFTITTPEELMNTFGSILNIITAFLLGVSFISLLVGSVGIANTMYTSVLERTKEIGTMKAIGAKNSDILLIFIIESGMLGAVGGAIGILFGYLVGKTIEYIAINQLDTTLLKIATPWYLILGCLLFAFLIGVISGLLPAKQASKLKPADTLRYE